MKHKKQSVAVVSMLVGLACNSALVKAEGPYTPEQAVSVFYQNLRTAINPDLPKSHWLSLSMVGAVAEAEDPSIVNDLGNFCPEPSPLVTSFTRARRLDGIYQKVLDGMTGPFRPPTDEFKEAMKYLRNDAGEATPEFKAYIKREEAYVAATSKYLQEKDSGKRAALLQDIIKSERDWTILGYRSEVDAALLAIEQNDTPYSPVKLSQRKRVLSHYRNAGLIPSDIVGAFKAPTTELSPPVALWENATGWTKFTYSSSEVDNVYDARSTQERGFGGISLGFVTVAGTGGGNKDYEHKVNEVKKFSYSFEIKRVIIRRPWLDTEVFFQPGGWTWKKTPNTVKFPRVSEGLDAVGTPVTPSAVVYDNTPVDCGMLPLELIIARKRELVATTSKSDYEKVVTSGSSGGGGSAFGIFGGGKKKSWTTTHIEEHGDDVTFKIEAPSTAVIGFISEVIPRLPEPNRNDTWPETAWME